MAHLTLLYILYNLTTLLPHLKRNRSLTYICTLYNVLPPIHCDPSLNACLVPRACTVDVKLT